VAEEAVQIRVEQVAQAVVAQAVDTTKTVFRLQRIQVVAAVEVVHQAQVTGRVEMVGQGLFS
jgi:hypothetical protein